MGYHTGFALHHKSQDNPYNLSYDLIELFRPLVDYIVFNNSASFKETLDKQYLRDVLNQRIKVLGVDYELK
jgi:CRISPR-associated protein Cas1